MGNWIRVGLLLLSYVPGQRVTGSDEFFGVFIVLFLLLQNAAQQTLDERHFCLLLIKRCQTETRVFSVLSNMTMASFEKKHAALINSCGAQTELLASTWLEKPSFCHLFNRRAIDVQIRCFAALICFSLGFLAVISRIFPPVSIASKSSVCLQTHYEVIFGILIIPGA